MNAITVDVAKLYDVAELVELVAAFYAESDFVLDRPWAKRSFTYLPSMPALGCVWLARAGGLAVGHAVLSVRYTMEHGALGGYVDDLYVRPKNTRQHVASQMLQALLEEGLRRACASFYVEVGASNRAALATYGAGD